MGIYFVHNTFHHLFFRCRHCLSFLGSCRSYQVSLAFLITTALVPHSNSFFWEVEGGRGLFYFSILLGNCICLPDCWVLHFFSRTVWQIFFRLFCTSMQPLFRTQNYFITLRRYIFGHVLRWRLRWWLWCLWYRPVLGLPILLQRKYNWAIPWKYCGIYWYTLFGENLARI